MATLPIDEAIFSVVTGDSTCASRISFRMYPGQAPQSIDPETTEYLIYSFSGGQYSHTMAGRDPDTVRDLTIMGYCQSESARMSLAMAVLDAIDPLNTIWPKTITIDGDSIKIQHCLLKENGEDFKEYVPAEEGGSNILYVFSQTYEIAYSVA
jgi:hypothetical protein